MTSAEIFNLKTQLRKSLPDPKTTPTSMSELIKTVVGDLALQPTRIRPLVWHLRNGRRPRENKGRRLQHTGWRARRVWQEEKTTCLASVSHHRSHAAPHVLNVSTLMPEVICLRRQPSLLYCFRLLAIRDFSQSSLFHATETRKQAARVSTHYAFGRIH